MLSRACLLFFIAVAAFGATLRLYLKDGTYQSAREYQVLQDRVHYYSTERSEWEDIPLDLVDLDRTRKEVAEHEASAKADAKAQSEEDAAERADLQDAERVPAEPGAYLMQDGKFEPLKQAESKVVSNKKRTVLKMMSPLPVVSGKATLEVDGESASFRVPQNRPEFYIRLAAEEDFNLVKLTPKKGGNSRIIETLTIVPLTKEVLEDAKPVPTFKRQLADLLFKIWPEESLEPGEYGLIEYKPVEFSDKSTNLQLWDFGVNGGK